MTTRTPTAEELLAAFDAWKRACRVGDKAERAIDDAVDKVDRLSKGMGFISMWWMRRADLLKLVRAERAAARGKKGAGKR